MGRWSVSAVLVERTTAFCARCDFHVKAHSVAEMAAVSRFGGPELWMQPLVWHFSE